MFRLRIAITALMLLMPPLALAVDMPGLQSIPGGESVSLDRFRGHKLLVAFFRSDCPPCVAEQPILSDIAKAYPDLHVALVTLDGDAYHERHFPLPAASNITVLSSREDTGPTLVAMGDKEQSLPFSVMLRADGKTCKTHAGLLGTALADDWVRQC